MVNSRYSVYCISVTQNNCQLEKRISPISSQLGLVSNNTINESYSEISSVASCLLRNNDSQFFFYSFCLFRLYFSFHTGKNSHFPLHHSVSLVVDVAGDEGGGGDIPAVHPRQAGVPGLGGNL